MKFYSAESFPILICFLFMASLRTNLAEFRRSLCVSHEKHVYLH